MQQSRPRTHTRAHELVLLTNEDVTKAIPMREVIGVVGQAFAQLHTKEAQAPLRSRMSVGNQGASLFMPAHLSKTGALGIKIVSVRPKNAEKGLPTVPAVVMLVDEATGVPTALIDATALTAIRTAAGSAVATHALAKKDSRVMVVFGVGEQAQAHIEAICAVRSIKEVYIINRTKSKAVDLQRHYQTTVGRGFTQIEWHVVDKDSEDENRAVSRADIIVTATNSSTPVFKGKYLKPGVHINAIGSYTPSVQELDEESVRKAKIVVDSREAALKEPGDIVVPLQKGLIKPDSIIELGKVIAEELEVRQSDKDITLFKSVGNAVQDISVAHAVLTAALKQNLGQRAPLNFSTARL